MTKVSDQPVEEQIALWRGYVRRRQALAGPDVDLSLIRSGGQVNYAV